MANDVDKQPDDRWKATAAPEQSEPAPSSNLPKSDKPPTELIQPNLMQDDQASPPVRPVRPASPTTVLLPETLLPGEVAETGVRGPVGGLAGQSGWVAPTSALNPRNDPAATNATPFDERPDAPTWTHRAEPEAPTQIGRYFILKAIGEGGMGAVYLAEQREPIKRKVALKLIRGEFASKQMLIRFDSERQALARMDHANVAKVLDAGTSETGQPYFVMEYVAGKPIDQYADDRKLDIRARLALFLQACSAIAHAHAKAMIHRDIKAGNVLAYDDADGKPAVKVIDFGIAKAMGDEKLVEATATIGSGTVLGTPYAMSPEQADGNADIDTRTDVYALGVLLYELLVGRPPLAAGEFAGLSISKMLDLVRTKEPPRPSAWLASASPAEAETIATNRDTKPSALVRDLRRELEWIPLKALRKDRDRRYASVAELAEDVENYLASRPLAAGPESKVYRAKKFVRRNRIGVGGAVIAVGLIFSTAAWFIREEIQMLREHAKELADRVDEAERFSQRSESDRRAATEVVRFTRDVVSAASPYAGNAKATLTDGIRAAMTQLEARKPFTDEPAMRAYLESQVGEILSDAGDLEAGLAKLDSSISTLSADRSDQPDIQLELARALHIRGWIHFRLKHFEQARADDERSIAIKRGLGAPASAELAMTLRTLGLLQLELGEIEQGELSCSEALAIVHKLAGENRDQSSEILLTLGGIAERRHDMVAARRYYEEALDECLAVYPEKDLKVGAALNNLGNVLAQSREYEAAIGYLKRALTNHEAHGSDTLDDGLKTMATLASALRESGRLGEAESTYLRAIDGMKQRQPVMAKELANAQSGLGRTLLLTPGRKAEAEAPLLAAFEYRLRNRAEGLSLTGDALVRLYTELGQPAKAEAIRRQIAASTSQPS